MSRILFCLVPTLACASGPTAYPLRDGCGAPACGNIGQLGRPGLARARPPAAHTQTVVQGSAARPRSGSLLAAGVNDGAPVARPLLDAHARPAPGNCAGKCDSTSGFSLEGTPVGGTRTAAAIAAHLAGSRIAAVGDGALVIDEDSGNLILTDALARNTAYVAIGRGAGLLVFDPASRLAYVADRRGNRIAVVRVGRELEIVRDWPTPVEPYGVALAPDRRTLLVTAIADRAVIAYDAATGDEQWRAGTGPEPRGIAIAPDGAHAAIASLTSGGIDRLELATRRITHAPLARAPASPQGRPTFARAGFALTFLGSDQVVVPFQRERPIPDGELRRSRSYGGGGGVIQAELAFLRGDAAAVARVPTDVPRALAWDGVHDVLYVAGMGTDLLQEVADASKATIRSGRRIPITRADEPRCGPDGIALSAERTVRVWCAFTRKVAHLDLAKGQSMIGPQLVASALAPLQHAGMVSFHASDARLSARGALACATCHPEGRSDGLSWSSANQLRQTPLLAGRVAGTQPFMWDGSEPTLHASVLATITQLGGRGADARTIDQLTAYLESMPPIPAPTRDAAAVARGRRVFDLRGCNDCHDGARYTDRNRHRLRGGLPSDTPSLLGLAASAPYYHDGSAATLEVVLRGGGEVHMTDARLTDREIADLTTFLETL